MKIIFIIIVIGLVAGFVVLRNPFREITSLLPEVKKGADFSGSLESLQSSGKPLRCTLKDVEISGVADGVFYTNNGKTKAEFYIKPNNSGEMQTYVILDDQWAYTWTSVSNMGFKQDVNELGKASSQDQQNLAADLKRKYNYKCEDWVPDESKFVPPKEVVFTEIGAIIME